MANCRNCGQLLADDGRFCGSCGSVVEVQAQQSSAAPHFEPPRGLKKWLTKELIVGFILGFVIAFLFCMAMWY